MQNILLDNATMSISSIFWKPFSNRVRFARLEPIFKFEMTRMGSEADMVTFSGDGASPAGRSLDEVPTLVYRGVIRR